MLIEGLRGIGGNEFPPIPRNPSISMSNKFKISNSNFDDVA